MIGVWELMSLRVGILKIEMQRRFAKTSLVGIVVGAGCDLSAYLQVYSPLQNSIIKSRKYLFGKQW
ncbi:hypothetical protein O71_19912 [Pontibacter sp. BAB1700]|nr:hypothetical protein O71_19912 [Pontibacter sp. BAB1700]